MPERIIHNEAETAEIVKRMAQQIIDTISSDELAKGGIIGIHRQGVPFARMLAAEIKTLANIEVPVGTLDINMYRDDIGYRKTLPAIHATDIPFDLEDNVVILADDVLHTGRSIRAALDAVTDFGRPRIIRLAVIVDRGARELPIQADVIGMHYDVEPGEWIQLFDRPGDQGVIGIGPKRSQA